MKKFLLLILASSIFSFSSYALERPSKSDLSVVFHLNPATRTPQNELGFSVGLGLAPYDFDTMEFRLMVEPMLLFNIPYRPSDGNLKDLAFVIPVLFGVTPQLFLGVTGGVAVNFSTSTIPVLFVGLGARYFPVLKFFVHADVGYSASGYHYLNGGVGYAF